MYPAQALADELYAYEDLPDEIIGGGTTYNKLNPPENSSVGLAYYIANNSQPLGTGDEDVIIITDDNWVRWTGGSIGGPGQCLINSLDGEPEGISERFEDQFADTYTVSGNPNFDQTVARTSLGFWIGEGTGVQESNATVFYMRCSDLRIGYSESDWDAWWMTLGASDTIAKKTGDQNTPEGSYPFGDIIGTMTVS
jgi:hypothetical protein